jgi:serine/threonine protein phosphatase 1
VYAIGDIHGRADLLGRLHRQIMADAADASSLRKMVVYLGDYVDRGPDSAAVIGMLINDPLEGFERHHLKGNHEAMMIRFLETGDGGEIWLMNGARDTLDSYGIGLSAFGLYHDDLDSLAEAFAAAVPESHRAFLNSLELHHKEGDYLFVHAGVLPGVAIEDQSEHDLIWIRDAFTRTDADFGVVVVHGHTIRNEPEIKANRIGIDTGAWHSNRLTALVLETATRSFLRT